MIHGDLDPELGRALVCDASDAELPQIDAGDPKADDVAELLVGHVGEARSFESVGRVIGKFDELRPWSVRAVPECPMLVP